MSARIGLMFATLHTTTMNTKIRYFRVLLVALLSFTYSSLSFAGIIYAVNHTHWAVNWFAVNGINAVDSIGAYQGGGGAGGYAAPEQWTPDLTVKIDWETGKFDTLDFPGFADWPKYLEWKAKGETMKRQYSKVVPVPYYESGSKTCGITVHFLVCNEIKVTTSCYPYRSPNYPIKDPIIITDEDPAECVDETRK